MKKMLIIYCLLVISAIQSYSQEIFGAVMRGDLDKTKILLEAHPEWTKKSMEIVNSMWNELGTINLEDEVQKITTPMLLITDVKDIGVPFHILEIGYKNYGGPKEHVLLKNSNHKMFVDEPDLFVSKIIEFLLR